MKNKGITLIALIITIIVMLILVAVTVSYGINSGLLSKSKTAGKKYDIEEEREMLTAAAVAAYDAVEGKIEKASDLQDELGDEWNVTGENPYIVITPNQNKFTVEQDGTIEIKDDLSPTQSYVGWYADTNGDGEADGVIFADLLATTTTGTGTNKNKSTVTGNWGLEEEGAFSYTTITKTKAYSIGKEHKENNNFDNYGENKVISAKEGSTGNDRFYVIALKDISSNGYYWYNKAQGTISSKTSEDFGTGKANTYNMIKTWNSMEFGEQTTTGKYIDLWGTIGTTDWFVLSRAEWSV